jgi:uncharacterized membrane protein
LAGTEDICRNYLPQEKDRMSLQLKNQRPKNKKIKIKKIKKYKHFSLNVVHEI